MEKLIAFANRFKGFLGFAALIFLGLLLLVRYLFSQGSFDKILGRFGDLSPSQFLSVIYIALSVPFLLAILLIVLGFISSNQSNRYPKKPSSGLLYVIIHESEDKTKGIADAEVRLMLPEPRIARSDSAGSARFALPAEFAGNKYFVNASKQGYQTRKAQQAKLEHGATVYIEMKRELILSKPREVRYNQSEFRSSFSTPRRASRSLDPSNALKLSDIDQTMIPLPLKNLLESDAQFIDIPLPDYLDVSVQNASENYFFCELRMRQTKSIFVFRTHRLIKIGDAAEYLVLQTLPHLDFEDYEWTIVHNDNPVPSQHTFATSRIRSGDTVLLLGDHRRPSWAPRM